MAPYRCLSRTKLNPDFRRRITLILEHLIDRINQTIADPTILTHSDDSDPMDSRGSRACTSLFLGTGCVLHWENDMLLNIHKPWAFHALGTKCCGTI